MALNYYHVCQSIQQIYKGVDAATGFLVDMRMYKYPDFRCLKPKPGLPSSEWPHYDMKNYRTAMTEQQLQKVEEIPFNKESHQQLQIRLRNK